MLSIEWILMIVCSLMAIGATYLFFATVFVGFRLISKYWPLKLKQAGHIDKSG